MKCLKWEVINLSELENVSIEISKELSLPCVVILTGPVGAGKTTFVRSFLKESSITSPTYSVINDFGHIAHADFYRLKDAEEVTHLELDLYSEGKDIFFIEWGMDFLEDIKYFLEITEFNYYELNIEPLDGQIRTFTLSHI